MTAKRGLDGSLQSALGGHVAAIDDLHVVDGTAAITNLHLQLALGTLSAVQQSLALLKLSRKSSGLPLRDANLLHDLGARASLILVQLDGLLQLALVALDGLDTLRVGLVGVVQANLQLVDLTLKSLLDTEGLTLGLLLSLQGSRYGLHGTGMVLPGVVELLLLLGHTPVDLLLHLSELELGAENLVLLLLQGSLSLLQSSLQLLLLLLQTAPLLVQIMDGASTLTKLIKQILDLISEVLVLALDNIQLLNSLILGSLQPEQLRRVVSALVLGGGHLGRDIGGLGLPLAQNLVKVLAPLLSDESSGMHPLVLHGEVIKLRVHPALGLLGISHLGGQAVNKLGLQLVASSLKLLNAAHSLGLIAGLPQLDLSLGLGKSLKGITLPGILILKLLPKVLQVSGEHLVLGQERGAVLVLSIGEGLGILQLGGDRDLALVHVSNGSLKLINLAGQILVLNLQALLGRLSLVQSTSHLIKPGVGINNGSLEQLASLVQLSLALNSVLQVTAGIAQIKLHVGLVLLRLDLVRAQAVNLLTKISHGVVVLHAKSSKSSLMGNVQLLELALEATKLTLPLLVQLNLSSCVGASLLKTRCNILNVLLQHGAALLRLGAVVALNSQLLIQLLKPSSKLLGLLSILGSQSSLIIDLGSKSATLLVLASSSALQLTLDTLKISNSLLSQLEVSLNLPLALLNISLHLLLTLKSILSLIKSLLKLSLNLGQVVALVLGSLDVLLGLLATVSSGPLFLAQLGDHVSLVGNLVLQGADLIILVSPILLRLGKCTFSNSNFTLKLNDSGIGFGHGALKLNLGGLLTLDPGIDLLQVLLLASKAIIDSLDLCTGSHGRLNVGISLGNLVLVLLLELAELGALEVGLDGKPQLEPQPGLGHHVGTDGTLAGVQGHLLVLQLLELHPSSLASGTGLQPGKDRSNLVLTLLFHPATNAGPEEHKSVSKTELLLVQLDNVHDSLGGSLVVLGLRHSCGSNDVEASLELRVCNLVGEASTADGDTSKHTIALVLVHDQARLHTTGLLVGVGHHTTDEVGVSLV